MEATLQGKFIIAYNATPFEKALDDQFRTHGLELGPVELNGAYAIRHLQDQQTHEALTFPTLRQIQFIAKHRWGERALFRKGVPYLGVLNNYLKRGASYANTWVLANHQQEQLSQERWPGKLLLSLEYSRQDRKGSFECNVERHVSGFSPQILLNGSSGIGQAEVQFPSADALAKLVATYVLELKNSKH